MTDQEIKELVDKKVLKNITDYAVQTVLRRVLFYDKNKIDWQDFYENMKQQMPELTLMGESDRDIKLVVNKILEGADVRQVLAEDNLKVIENKNNLDIEWANADSVGSGTYNYIGKLKNGHYFMAADDWNDAGQYFVYEVDSKVVFDTFTEDDPAPWSNEWLDEHTVILHGKKAFKQVLNWIIENVPDGNYSKGEIERILKRI